VAQGAPFCMVKTYIEKSIVIQEEEEKKYNNCNFLRNR
jgi:hypothetical protein